MNQQPKEIDVFNRHNRFSKLKVIGISLLIAIVASAALYFLIKTLLTYTVTYNLNGGSVYKSTLEPTKHKFLSTVEEPKNVKKEGYYIEYWSDKKDLSRPYTFGTPVWNSFTLHVNWKEGVAVRLHFAEGEENSDMPLADLKGYYEQYVKPGSDWTLPVIYNNTEGSLHKGEQLMWFTTPDCTDDPLDPSDDPFETKEYKNLTDNIDIYGKWFDTDPEKFQVDENGTLQKYLGYCNKVFLPSTVRKIKDIDPVRFTAPSDMIHDQAGTYQSVWQNVFGDENGVNSLQIIYLNKELIEIGDCAFRDCIGLERVYFRGDNVESFGENAFANCRKLWLFSIPSKVTIIPKNCFAGAFNGSKKVELDLNNVTRIEGGGFINSKIYKVYMPKVEYIGTTGQLGGAFANNSKLEEVVITSSALITSNASNNITYGMFYTCDLNPKIYVPAELYDEYLTKIYWKMYESQLYKIEK